MTRLQNKIYKYIESNPETRVIDVSRSFGMSRQAAQSIMCTLKQEGHLTSKPPRSGLTAHNWSVIKHKDVWKSPNLAIKAITLYDCRFD